MIWRYHYFWKHPYLNIMFVSFSGFGCHYFFKHWKIPICTNTSNMFFFDYIIYYWFLNQKNIDFVTVCECMLDTLFQKPLLIKLSMPMGIWAACVARSNVEKFLAAQTSRVTWLHWRVATIGLQIWLLYKTRWWFQIFFIFTPIWGNYPIWLIFFKWVETTN